LKHFNLAGAHTQVRPYENLMVSGFYEQQGLIIGTFMLKNITKLLALALLLQCPAPGLSAAQADTANWKYKVDLGLRTSWRREQSARAGLSAAAARDRTRRKVLVRLSRERPGPLPRGIRLLSRRGELATAVVDLERLPEVAASPTLSSIRAERRFLPCDDPGVLSIRARRVPLKLGITGRGVLIGILDSGLDWRHPDFLSGDGSTRIAAILDLSLSPEELAGVPAEFRGPFGGVLITREQIEQALAGNADLPTRDYMGHGTHCAGTAAAAPSAASSPVGVFGGVAPGAGIIGVKVSPTQRDSVFSEVNILNGLEFIDSLATALGSPWVANMSFGGTLGPHDGSTEFDKYIDRLAAPGAVGRALVVAAGNESNKGTHAEGEFGSHPGDSVELQLVISGEGSHNDEMRVEVWLSEGHPGLTMTLVTPAGVLLGPFEDGYGDEEPLVTDEGILIVENAFGGPDPDSGDRLVAIEFYDGQAWWPDSSGSDISIALKTWRIILASGTGFFDAYLYGTHGLGARFGSHQSRSGTVTEPGTSPELITVGAYVSRTEWPSAGNGEDLTTGFLGGSDPGTLAYFSGLGPNRKDVLKPEITAPGRWIMASMSGFAWPLEEKISMYESPLSNKPLLMVAPDSIHAISQGTSFSTPHVAGLCALLLEADPTLSHAGVKSILSETATQDSLASGLPDNTWGYGRANAVGAVRRALGVGGDSLFLAGSLGRQDTLAADSLVYSVIADFTASPRVLRSFACNIGWPHEFLYLKELPDSLGARGELILSFDTSLLDSGRLGIRGYSAAGVATRDTLLSLVLMPGLTVGVDSVQVVLDLLELRGELDPVELGELVLVEQAAAVSLGPAVCRVAGDVDGSGKVNIFDLLALLRLLTEQPELPQPCADLDNDGKVNIFDLIGMLRLLNR